MFWVMPHEYNINCIYTTSPSKSLKKYSLNSFWNIWFYNTNVFDDDLGSTVYIFVLVWFEWRNPPSFSGLAPVAIFIDAVIDDVQILLIIEEEAKNNQNDLPVVLTSAQLTNNQTFNSLSARQNYPRFILNYLLSRFSLYLFK